jgi:hypothetical protein
VQFFSNRTHNSFFFVFHQCGTEKIEDWYCWERIIKWSLIQWFKRWVKNLNVHWMHPPCSHSRIVTCLKKFAPPRKDFLWPVYDWFDEISVGTSLKKIRSKWLAQKWYHFSFQWKVIGSIKHSFSSSPIPKFRPTTYLF